MDIPAELERREDRLKALEEAKAKLVQRAAERQKAEQAEYETKMERREAKRKKTGRKPRGPKPKPPTGGVRDKDQINLTDEESRIMPVSGGGFEQAYNAQARKLAKTFAENFRQYVGSVSKETEEAGPSA